LDGEAMTEKGINDIIEKESYDLSYVIQAVGKRGITDSELQTDQYSLLLMSKEFRDLVVCELYETYFLPERHEFDWQILQEMVRILTNEKVREFVATTVIGGILGNGAFAAVRSILDRILSSLKDAGLVGVRQEPFLAMKANLEEIERFFGEQECSRIAEIESNTKVPREKLYPILKLLGFQHHRRANNCFWCRPGGIVRESSHK
jgi:hypothetical protein